MEIEEDIYNKYRDTPYKFPDKSDQQESEKEDNNNNNRKNDAYKEFVDKIKKVLMTSQIQDIQTILH